VKDFRNGSVFADPPPIRTTTVMALQQAVDCAKGADTVFHPKHALREKSSRSVELKYYTSRIRVRFRTTLIQNDAFV